VIKHFPEDASLSSAGAARYDRILPVNSGTSLSKLALVHNDDDSISHFQLDDFCRRILAGLSKLMIENRYDDIRNSLEYISKKKYQVPMLNTWPSLFPNEEEGSRGDLCWFLWGALSCFYGEDNVATNLKLFSWNWRKSVKNDRIGLLFGFPYTTNTNVLSEWSYNENLIIEKIEQSANDLWKQYRNMAAGKESEDEDDETQHAPLDRLFSSYIPRTTQHEKQTANYVSSRMYSSEPEPRVISYNGRSEQKKDRIKVSRSDSDLDHAFTRIPFNGQYPYNA